MKGWLRLAMKSGAEFKLLTYLVGGLFLLWALQSSIRAENRWDCTARPAAQSAARQSPAGATVAEIARQVTVRILADETTGSGAIVDRQGQIYTVVTNDHVANSPENRYTVLTADGKKHPAWRLKAAQFGELDLALVQFHSSNAYQVAVVGDSRSLSVGEPVCAAGFPRWHYTKNGNIITELQDTRDWGLRAYRLTAGKVGMQLARSLSRGYGLGYTNDIEQGMSGGPVLNQKGELIGINGKSKYPWGGISAFAFADGTLPEQALFQQMETLSWAIPSAAFGRTVGGATGL